ncbi:efflux RND transporter permease subunit [uncultured Sunxiuqinia sp.]|uniref:efflux RND transporter permease subunit n=1 Tax=uncultured Sunxiuqinia sp. TaxID=1573825 RepID=UPI00261B8C8A|nr:efflux RND transporter permease subunit [uncultured Sunxiuqinia sp.]
MLNKIIDYSLKNRLVVLIMTTLILGAGIFVSTEMEVDVFPDLNAPTVVVLTEANGMAPEEVERLVTFPIETAVNGATNIRRVRSSSAMGFSIVWVEFDWNMDIYNARQIVSEKLATIADQMPTGVGSPTLAPQSSIMGEIMMIALTADETSPMDLRTLAEWNIRPRLLSVGGVAQVAIIGGELKEFQVLADPLKMAFHKVSFSELIEACQFSNENVSGGFLNEHGQEYLVRGIARSNSTDEIGNNLVKMNDGMPVKVSDVATVKIGAAPKIGDGAYRAEDAIIMTITKQPNVNTLELTEKIHESLSDLQKTLPADVGIHTDIFEQAKFIQTSVNNVQKALIEGGIFVVIILFVFLMNFRTTLISVLAIPLSLLVAILAMKWMGISINTMTLGGMTIAIGSLVDDAIIDVENVFKRLRENSLLPKADQHSVFKVIYKASVEIRASILNATLIIIVAFVPLFFLSGMEGRMLKPLGIAYIVSLFASLFVALTVIPVLSSYLLTDEKRLQKQARGSRVERFLRHHYTSTLDKALRYRKTVLGVSIAAFVLTMLLLTGFGRSFLPPFNEGSLTINTTTMPGINLEESNKIGTQAEKLLLTIPEISSVARRTGRAEMAEHSFGVNVSEIDAPYQLEDRSREEFLHEVREKLNSIDGISIEVGQPISHRIDAMLSGSKTNIAIKLFGTDLNDLFRLANQIRDEIQDIEGIGDLSVEQQIEIPQLQIKPRREMLARYGISVNELLEFVDYAYAGKKISDVFENEKAFNLVLRFDDEYRDQIEAIQNGLIDTPNGQKVPLSYVADIQSTFGPNTIGRENVMRKIVVAVNVANRDVRSVVNDIQDRVDANIALPENYHIEYGGQFESEASASRILLIASLGALLIIFILLYVEFKNTQLALIILINLPLALIGGVIAIWFTSGVISIPSIIGFITLFGIATRNGILLISRYQSLSGQLVSLKERIIEGSADRLNPILMTALTAALALIPLALAGDKPGNEIQSPMAIVILGGLLSSTLLNSYIVPIIYYLFQKKQDVKSES